MRFLVNLLLPLAWGVAADMPAASAQQSDFHAIVEPDGKVVLCIVNGEIIFPDRCAGTGRLTIVQPIKEGPVVWRFAVGTVTVENDAPNPDCALSHAKWDPGSERAVASGKEIELIDPTEVLAQIDTKSAGMEDVTEDDISAFALDLDNDGNPEVIFIVKSFQRPARNSEKPFPYLLRGGVLKQRSQYPATFYNEQGETPGDTDDIGHLELKGIAPLSFDAGEIALLVKAGYSVSGDQLLVRYRSGLIRRIETFEYICN